MCCNKKFTLKTSDILDPGIAVVAMYRCYVVSSNPSVLHES